jgi:nucleotide-binding universal stress UspA family protein
MSKRMRVLVAYDGSESADAAIDDLRLAGLPSGVEAVVISVGELWLSPASNYSVIEKKLREQLPFGLKEAETLALRACDRIMTDFPNWEVHPEAHVGSVPGKIIRKADEWRSDLIVIGSHGLSALGNITLGSVSQKVVTATNCSVRIGRSHKGEWKRPVKIIIGIDGSPDSKAAVDAVASRVWPADSEVRLVTAVNSENIEELDYVKDIQNSPKSELSAVGLNVSTLVKKGNPKQILLEQAEGFSADSIFVGARGFSRIRRLILGSVSIAIASRAGCSVEVVRTE